MATASVDLTSFFKNVVEQEIEGTVLTPKEVLSVYCVVHVSGVLRAQPDGGRLVLPMFSASAFGGRRNLRWSRFGDFLDAEFLPVRGSITVFLS